MAPVPRGRRGGRALVLGALFLGALGALASCGGGSQQDEVLDDLVRDVIVPRYEAAAVQMDGLHASLEALCAAPSQGTLEAAREQWLAAREEWLRSSASWFGPAMDRRSRSLVSWPVTDRNRIEALVARGGDIGTFEVRETLASSQVGLGAIEYLIFEDDNDDAAILTALSDSTPRCDFLVALGAVAADEVQAVRDEWVEGLDGAEAYAEVVTGGASVSLSADAAIEEIVRTSIFLVRSITDTQLGPALGIVGSQPDMTAIPGGSGRADVADMRAQILGVRDIYLGGDPGDEDIRGISDLVADLATETDDRVRAAFEEALAAIDALEPPLSEQIERDPAAVQNAYDRLKDLQRVLDTEVVSLLGVTVGFGDIDGDTG